MLIYAGGRIINLGNVETITYTPKKSSDQLVLAERQVGVVRHVQKVQNPDAGWIFEAITQAATREDSLLILWEMGDEKSTIVNGESATMIAFDPNDGKMLKLTLSGVVIGKRGDEAEQMWRKLQRAVTTAFNGNGDG